MNYIVKLKPMSNPNRFGSCFITYILTILRGIQRKYKIQLLPTHKNYNNYLISILIDDYLIDYNLKLNIKDTQFIPLNLSHDHCKSGTKNNECIVSLMLKTTLETQQDLFSLFKSKMYPYLNYNIFSNCNILTNCNSKKYICVHIRLDDLTHFHTYDGNHSFTFFKNKINEDNDSFVWKDGDYDEFLNSNNIQKCCRGKLCHQSPIDYKIIDKLIKNILIIHPEHEVIIVSSKNGHNTIPLSYKKIYSDDIDTDLQIMINSDILVCSRSLFCWCAALFHKGSKIYMPKWGYISAAGLGTKYDKSKIIIY